MRGMWAGAALVCGALVAFAPAWAFDPTPSEAYAKPQTRVAVEGARRLNMYCEGTGSPVVLLDAGLGGSGYVWRQVQRSLAAHTRVCAYDRAGVGFSDPSPHPSDVVHIVADLHRLIRSQAIGGPVIYVGHSIAGLYGLRLAADFPEDISGEVLVDPSVAGQFKRAMTILPPEIGVSLLHARAQEVTRLETCVKLARRHRLRAPQTDAEKGCTGTDDGLDPVLRDSLARQYATPQYQAANLSEQRSAAAGFSPSLDEQQVLSIHPRFGDKPLTVLTAGIQMHAPGVTAEQGARLEVMSKQAHDRQAQLSQDGRSILVPGSGHFIQGDKPDVVIDEVVAVVEKVRSRPQK